VALKPDRGAKRRAGGAALNRTLPPARTLVRLFRRPQPTASPNPPVPVRSRPQPCLLSTPGRVASAGWGGGGFPVDPIIPPCSPRLDFRALPCSQVSATLFPPLLYLIFSCQLIDCILNQKALQLWPPASTRARRVLAVAVRKRGAQAVAGTTGGGSGGPLKTTPPTPARCLAAFPLL